MNHVYFTELENQSALIYAAKLVTKKRKENCHYDPTVGRGQEIAQM